MAKNALYLGTILNDWGHTEEELSVRLAKALALCKALRPIWATKSLEAKVAVRVLRSCVFSSLIYGLHTMVFTNSQEKRIDGMQIRCIRRALGIKSTYADKLLGREATSNREVTELVDAKPLSAGIRKMRYQMLGHVLRREGSDPLRAVSYDRLGQPKSLSGTRRAAATRKTGRWKS